MNPDQQFTADQIRTLANSVCGIAEATGDQVEDILEALEDAYILSRPSSLKITTFIANI